MTPIPQSLRKAFEDILANNLSGTAFLYKKEAFIEEILNLVANREEDVRAEEKKTVMDFLIKAMSGKLTINKSDFGKLVDYLEDKREETTEEFPQGKEAYCPRCYFEDEKTILRKDCPHNADTDPTHSQ